MKQPATLLIFTGLPGTGKTSLSAKAADHLGLPLIAKDALKELLFDSLGWGDREWSAKLGGAVYNLLDHIVEQELRGGCSFILESNFSPQYSNQKFARWQQTYNCNVVQVVCRTDLPVLAKRLLERATTSRHPGHQDKGTEADFLTDLQRRASNGEDQPLDIPGQVVHVDTTDFPAVDTGELLRNVQQAMLRTARSGNAATTPLK